MSETSHDYEMGFRKLLPNEGCPLRYNSQLRREMPMCPDIRAPGNEALAWRAQCALRDADSVAWFDYVNDLLVLMHQDIGAILYAAIEALGRTP